MALYREGTASMDAQGNVTGKGTKWKEPLALIRVGATMVFLTSPPSFAVVNDIVDDTHIKAIGIEKKAIPESKYVILLNDSLTVDGLAQDVAETLRYYQSKETEIAGAIEFFENYDAQELIDLKNTTVAKAAEAKESATHAKSSADAAATSQKGAKTSQDAAAASATAAANSQKAAKTSETNAKASETAAKTSQTEAKKSQDAAHTSAVNAQTAEKNAKASETAAKTSQTEAKKSQDAAAASAAAAKTSQTEAKKSQDAAAASATAAKNSQTAAKTSETNAANSATKAKNEADRAEQAANTSDAKDKVPFSGAVINPKDLGDMMLKLRDQVKGGFWRSGAFSAPVAGQSAPYTHGTGVCGHAGDTFFAMNVDYASGKIRMFASNDSNINKGDGVGIKVSEFAWLNGGKVDITLGGTGAKDAKGARSNLGLGDGSDVTFKSVSTPSMKMTAQGVTGRMVKQNWTGKTQSLDSIKPWDPVNSPDFTIVGVDTDGGGSGVTGRPHDDQKVAFLCVTQAIRKVNNGDFVCIQSYVAHQKPDEVYTRYCRNNTWSAWTLQPGRTIDSVFQKSLVVGGALTAKGDFIVEKNTRIKGDLNLEKRLIGNEIISQNGEIKTKGDGDARVRFLKADGQTEKAVIWASADNVFHIRTGGKTAHFDGPNGRVDFNEFANFFPYSVQTKEQIKTLRNVGGNHNNGDIVTAAPLQSCMGGRGANGDAAGAVASIYMEEQVGTEHRCVIYLDGFGRTTAFLFKADGNITGPLGAVQFSGSDVRIKNSFMEPKSGARERIMNLGVSEFKYNGSDRVRRGFLAQQADTVDDIYTFQTGEQEVDGEMINILNVDQTAILADAVTTIQEMDEENKALKSEVEDLKARLEKLEALLTK